MPRAGRRTSSSWALVSSAGFSAAPRRTEGVAIQRGTIEAALCALTTAHPSRGESETASEEQEARRFRNGLLHDDIAASIAQIGTDRTGLSVASHDVGDEVDAGVLCGREFEKALRGQIWRLDV